MLGAHRCASPQRRRRPRACQGDASTQGTAGPTPVPTDVVINERTTVASAYGLAQFIDGPRIVGKANGLQNAAGMVQNLARRDGTRWLRSTARSREGLEHRLRQSPRSDLGDEQARHDTTGSSP